MRLMVLAAFAAFALLAGCHRIAEAAINPASVQTVFDRHNPIGTYSHQQVAGGKQMRRKHHKHQRRYYRSRVAVKAAPRPLPGTLGAYRKSIEAASVVDAPLKGLGNIQGLQGHFIAKLDALRAAMPPGLGFIVGSGYRSYAEQARLHRLKPGLAARPGRSNHQRGLAGDLKFASNESSRWVHLNSRRYGLRFPMRHEPWHIEPIGATRFAVRHRRYAAAR